MTVVAPSSPPLSMDALRVMLGLFCRARRLFPDECFEQVQVHGDSVLVLKKPPLVDPGAERLYNMVEFGVAECLDRRCMRSISFFIMDAVNGQVVEEMTMKCDQNRGEYPSRTPNEALRELMQKHRLLVQTLMPLPQKTTFALRLTLIGATMPYPSWIPPFFRAATKGFNSKKRQLNDECVSLRIGQFDSAHHLCTMSIRSTQDPLEELSKTSHTHNDWQSDIAFDPEFTQVPASDAEVGMTSKKDVYLYQTIKRFVLSSSAPSMQRTHNTFKTVTMPTVRTYFSQICDEGLLERRGRRFYGVKKATSVGLRTSADDRTTPPTQRKRNSSSSVYLQETAVAKIPPPNEQCWISRTPIVSLSPQHTRFGPSTASDRPRAERERLPWHQSTRGLLVSRTPIIQAKPRDRPIYHPKLGRPVLVAATSIVQTSK